MFVAASTATAMGWLMPLVALGTDGLVKVKVVLVLLTPGVVIMRTTLLE